MKAYLHRYILCSIYQMADCFPRKDVSKFRHSIWHHQSTTTSCFQPPSTTPVTTTPWVTTIPNSHCCHRLPTTMAHNQQWNNQQQCGNTTSWATTQPQMTKNTQKWTQMTPPLTNDGQHLQMDTSNDELRWDSSPPPLFNPLIQNPGATSPSAMWKPNDEQWPRFVICHHCVVRAPPSIHPNPPCSHTAQQWTDDVGQQQHS